MFQIGFYDSYTRQITSSWWLYVLLGINLILLATLIVLFPELLAYLVAAFLLFDGLLFIIVGFQLWRLKRLYSRLRKELWSPRSAEPRAGDGRYVGSHPLPT